MKFLAAPWRWKFISGQAGGKGGCIFCQALANDDDEASLVCHRGRSFFVLLNRYPYNSGHLMVAPCAHLASPEEMAASDLGEMWELAQRSLAVLRQCFGPEGFNIGMNLGRAAGAGIRDHFHLHVVPRWQGDANFMAVSGGTRVLSYDLAAVHGAVRDAFRR